MSGFSCRLKLQVRNTSKKLLRTHIANLAWSSRAHVILSLFNPSYVSLPSGRVMLAVSSFPVLMPN